MKPRVMITGAAGFIASSFWRQFQDKYDLFGIDKYGYASQTDDRRHKCITGSHQIVEGDCADFGVVSDALDDAGALYSGYPATYPTVDKFLVLHAETHNDNSLKSPVEFYRSNVLGTVNALEAARHHSIKQVYLVSTDETIKHMAPDSGNCFVLDGPWGFDQVSHLNRTFYRAREMDMDWTFFAPTSPYSSSKACQEMIVNAYRKSYGMNITVIRPTNVFGPGQFPEKLIPVAITNALQDKPILLYGKGEQWRDYTYVEDTCRALDLILSLEAPDNLYHISANDERQNINTVREVLRLTGKKSESLIKFIPDPRGNSHDFSYSLSSAKIRNLGWRPEVDFTTGLQKTIDFYRNKG